MMNALARLALVLSIALGAARAFARSTDEPRRSRGTALDLDALDSRLLFSEGASKYVSGDSAQTASGAVAPGTAAFAIAVSPQSSAGSQAPTSAQNPTVIPGPITRAPICIVIVMSNESLSCEGDQT